MSVLEQCVHFITFRLRIFLHVMRPRAAVDIFGLLSAPALETPPLLKFRAILDKEGSLPILNQFLSYIPRAKNLNRQGHERVQAPKMSTAARGLITCRNILSREVMKRTH